jgi:hypothetical protein
MAVDGTSTTYSETNQENGKYYTAQ